LSSRNLRRCPTHGRAVLAHTAGSTTREILMNLVPHIGPVAALIAGVLILLIPRLLNYIVAIYLIVIGAVGLFGK
jgi:hypothetical protein